jgi:uncharacterized membrane protein
MPNSTDTVKSEPEAPAARSSDQLSEHVNQNIGSVVALHQREQERLTTAERRVELIARFISRPYYLLAVLAAVAVWIGFNLLAPRLGIQALERPPFEFLQGLITLASLATTTIVVMAQRRQARLEGQRAHLDLQVNLLTEQKVTKVIHLLEELRRDLPNVQNRHDPEADAFQQRTDAAQVLSALEEVGVGAESDEGR